MSLKLTRDATFERTCGTPAASASIIATGIRSSRRRPPGDTRYFHECVDIWQLQAKGNLPKPARQLMRSIGVMHPNGRGQKSDRVGDGTIGAIWDAFVAWMVEEERRRGDRPPDDEFFRIYRRARSGLLAISLPHPDVALRAYLAFVGAKNVSRVSMRRLLGSGPMLHEARFRLDKLLKGSRRRSRHGAKGEVSDLLNVLPPWARGRFEQHLMQLRHPATEMPLPRQIGRVCAMTDAGLQLRAALCLIAIAVDAGSISTQLLCVLDHNRHDDIIRDRSSGSQDEVTQALDLYAAGILLPSDLREPRARAAVAWRRWNKEARRVAQQVLGADADLLTELLPAEHRDGDALGRRMWKRIQYHCDVRKGKLLKKVRPLVSALTLVLAAVENRIAQLEGLLSALSEQMPLARERMKSGVRVGFEWRGPVVREDGSLGTTEQTIRFELSTEGELLAEARGRAFLQDRIVRRMSAGTNARGRYSKPRDAAHLDRIHLVYAGVEPCQPGGECVEPFWVDLFRWDVLDWSSLHSGKVRDRRRAKVAAYGLDEHPLTRRGLLIPSQKDREIALYARGEDPEDPDASRLVIPLIEFYHAMAYARVAIIYGIRWGARIGEILQIRLGPECFRSHTLDGEVQPYLSLTPKGWSTGGKFGLDGDSAASMKSLKLFTNLRLHPGLLDERGEPTLPVVRSRQQKRRLPPARYLFQHDGGMIRDHDLTLFCRVLLLGVVDMRSHDGRYIFATALGLGGSAYEEIGVLLHHSPGSALPMKYDLSGAITASAAAERFNKQMEVAIAGMSRGA